MLVVDVAADFTLAVGLDAPERTLAGLAGETLAAGTLSAGRLDPMFVATAGTVSDLTSGTGGAGGDATRSRVEVVAAAALLVVDATVVVAVETTAFVVVSTVDLASATVDATECATGTPGNPAPHDCAGQKAAAIITPAAIGPANDLVLTYLIGPPWACVLGWCLVYPASALLFMDAYGFVRMPVAGPSLSANANKAR